jgi:hypothetical protein
MSIRTVFLALIVLCSGRCYGQATYTVPLQKLNVSLAVPSMVARDGVVYVAYRSFDWLRQSDQLQVLAYDLNSRKVLRHGTISVPKVHGARATNGLALSRDGTMLAYVEMHEPDIVLLLSTKNFSEIRRSTVLPFTEQDHRRAFAGFDNDDQLSFMSMSRDIPRFVRVSTADFKVVSDIRASSLTKAVLSSYLTWNPASGLLWLPDSGGNVHQFTEDGQATGEALESDVHELDAGAISLGKSGLLAFFAMVSRGALVSYTNHKSQVLELPCSPRPYGISNDREYAGAICITQPDRLPEAGGDRVLTSEFLLIQTDGLKIVWRQKMSSLGAGDDKYFEWASAVIDHQGKKISVVAPTKSPELAVYEVSVPD